MGHWIPKEIIINEKVKDDPTTQYLLEQCKGVSPIYVSEAKAAIVTEHSRLLQQAKGKGLLAQIMAGKEVVFVAGATRGVADKLNIGERGMVCPEFNRLKFASNGCFYRCEWCYLKLTYRGNRPFIQVNVGYKYIQDRLRAEMEKSEGPVLWNSGELADSLSLDHLTGAAREFIPWFGRQERGYLYMLTKSDKVDHLINLEHNGHTIVCWSLNAPDVSQQYEVGAPSFERRLEAAQKAEKAGYRLRIRLDPVVPVNGWKELYADTIKRIFSKVTPERITLGTLRFEQGFHRKFISEGSDLFRYIKEMKPISSGPKGKGKKSFSDEKRIGIYKFLFSEIRKHTDNPIAPCKETRKIWEQLELDLSKCRCVCELEFKNMEGEKKADLPMGPEINTPKLKIDAEFCALIPPLGETERELLTESIIRDGCRDAIITWNGTIVDGHNRYGICKEYGKDFRTLEKEFPGRQEAMEWIIEQQLGRRNLTPEQKHYLIGAKYNNAKKPREDNFKPKDQNDTSGDTAKKIAEQFRISPAKVKRAARYASAIDTLAKNCKAPTREEILSRQKRLSFNKIIELAEKPEQDQCEFFENRAREAVEPKTAPVDFVKKIRSLREKLTETIQTMRAEELTNLARELEVMLRQVQGPAHEKG